MADFLYEDLLPVGEDTTEYRLLTTEGVSTVPGPDGMTFLKVDPEAIRLLTETAMHDISHYLRSDHLAQVAKILAPQRWLTPTDVATALAEVTEVTSL